MVLRRKTYAESFTQKALGVFPVAGFLAAGGEAAIVGDGDAEILVGIDRGVVDAHFVVEVGTGRASAGPNIADYVAAVDVLSRSDGKTREMAVAG